MDLFLAHSLGLIWASLGAARRLTARTTDRLLVAAMLAWGNLVATGLLLSVVHRLGEPRWFCSTSLVLATLVVLFGLKLKPEPLPADELKPNAWLAGLAALTLVPLALAAIGIAWTYQPNNTDALTYQLPRALYYLGQDSLAAFDAADIRQTHLPFNHDLLHVFGLVYGPPLQCLNFFNFVAWIIGGLAAYRLCRLCAVGPDASLVACWLMLTATPVMAQATSTSTELPAAAALLCAAGFALHWHQGRLMATFGASVRTLDSALAALNLDRLDCIKLDIDGAECAMLRGARQVLTHWHPVIIMELAPYVLEERGASLGELIQLLGNYGYALSDPATGQRLTMDAAELQKMIPPGASLNVVAACPTPATP